MWHFSQDGNRKGPVSLEEVKSLISQGIITQTTFVWKKGFTGWKAATETELKNLFPEDAPPPLPDEMPPPLPKEPTDHTGQNEQKLEPVGLLKDAFGYAGSIYVPMLTFLAPSLFVSFLMSIASLEGSTAVAFLLGLLSYLCVFPFATGASIFYVHKNLTQQGISIADAMKRATEKFSQLVLVTILLWIILAVGFLCLIIPGIYLSFRLSFVYYAVMIEKKAAPEALKRSWELTSGLVWQLFLAALMLGLAVFLPAAIAGGITAMIHPVLSSFAGGLIGFFIGPIIAIYYVFLFMRVVNFSTEQTV